DVPPTTMRFDTLEYDIPARDHVSAPGDERPAVDGDALLILFTSGTTGSPKAAVLTHSTCFWTNLSFSRAVPVSRDDVVLSLLPQHHVGSWNVQTLLAWWVGAKVVLERSFDPRRILELIRTRGITTMMGVPTHYRALADYRGFADADISSLTNAVVGGAPATEALLRTWLDRGVALSQGYGLTEAGPNVLCLLPEEASAHVGTAGRPYHHVEVRLVDTASGEVLDGAASGELQVRGPGLFAGYFGDEQATRDAFTPDGWLRTGDLVERDDDGYHTIIDRVDGLYISGGINVAPAEVEQALLAHPGVDRVLVIGVPDEKWGQVGLARVVRREDSTVDAQELLRHCRANLARYKVPAQIVFVPELPEGSLEKVRRIAIREENGS
ncbi:MAG: long-chain fatty acid--CoA ligase, partial [Propionibacterium sp.]|nr:long-chain fatty acid--CoA ligase [Propionibacterium sp.]